MIQRIQSIWLLLASLCTAGLLFFSFYTVTPQLGSPDNSLFVSHIRPLLVTDIVLIILPLAVIFQFKNRKRQASMAVANLILTVSFMTLLDTRAFSLAASVAGKGSWGVGSLLLPMSAIFLLLAIYNIRKDDKLVRSVDRLR